MNGYEKVLQCKGNIAFGEGSRFKVEKLGEGSSAFSMKCGAGFDSANPNLEAGITVDEKLKSFAM